MSQQVTIETLPDDILLNVFYLYLCINPQLWPTLAWVCQRWRQSIFTSPLGLNLRLYCTYGTPVLKTLDCWPVLPIAVQYGGVPILDPPSPDDEDNIIAALKQSGRVRSISLTITSSLFEKLSVISEPYLDLEELALLSQDNVQLTSLSTFRWGSRLRTLLLTRIAFPTVPQLLMPSQDLIDLQLHEIPSAGYFSPEAFVNALSGMTHLRSLSLHFLSLPPLREYFRLPPPSEERIVLPALILLKYRGASNYLDNFVARVDAPHLEDIDITFFSQPTIDASQLGRFIERTEMQISLRQADIETSPDTISISFTSPRASTHLRLQISCNQLDWQLSCMAQICYQISPLLFRVNSLGLITTQSLGRHDDVHGEQWAELVRAFGGAQDFRVAGDFLATNILRALSLTDGENGTVLPALRRLRLRAPVGMYDPLWETLWSSRRLSVDLPSPVLLLVCHICHASFTHARELKTHLVHKHAHQLVCLYCKSFLFEPKHDHLFRKHLKRKHREVARNDALISNPSLTPSQLVYLFGHHTSLRAPATDTQLWPTDSDSESQSDSLESPSLSLSG